MAKSPTTFSDIFADSLMWFSYFQQQQHYLDLNMFNNFIVGSWSLPTTQSVGLNICQHQHVYRFLNHSLSTNRNVCNYLNRSLCTNRDWCKYLNQRLSDNRNQSLSGHPNWCNCLDRSLSKNWNGCNLLNQSLSTNRNRTLWIYSCYTPLITNSTLACYSVFYKYCCAVNAATVHCFSSSCATLLHRRMGPNLDGSKWGPKPARSWKHNDFRF